MVKRSFNGSPTVDGYYTTFDSSEVHRIDESSDDQGGGGSSDFSTAEVTFVNNTADKVLLGAAALVVEEGEHSCVYGQTALANNGSYTFVLYKGLNVFTCNNSDPFTVTTSGNVTYDSEDGIFLITGDCTITIS